MKLLVLFHNKVPICSTYTTGFSYTDIVRAFTTFGFRVLIVSNALNRDSVCKQNKLYVYCYIYYIVKLYKCIDE